MLVKARHDKASALIKACPLNTDHGLSEARPPDHSIHRFGGVTMKHAISRMGVEYAPCDMQSANNPQPVRTQCGHNAENFRMCLEVDAHFDPVTGHYAASFTRELSAIRPSAAISDVVAESLEITDESHAHRSASSRSCRRLESTSFRSR
ncbi:hypothetical protein D3C81_1647130 [compost metagenome]